MHHAKAEVVDVNEKDNVRKFSSEVLLELQMISSEILNSSITDQYTVKHCQVRLRALSYALHKVSQCKCLCLVSD